ncbi:MAG: DUF2497 domain-containing protein, partial [Pseudolabrys sp.]
MSQAAKAQEPSMEEILASIRRIIADDDTGKTAKPPEVKAPEAPKAAAPAAVVPPRPAPLAPRTPPANKQEDIDAMLADIDVAPKVAPKPIPPKPAAPPPADVLDLTEAMAAPAPTPEPAPSFRTIVGDSDVVFTDPVEPRAETAARAPERPTPFDQGLISGATVSAVDSAFNSLAHTVLGNNARTLEDLVKEMLRPMLKGWLD